MPERAPHTPDQHDQPTAYGGPLALGAAGTALLAAGGIAAFGGGDQPHTDRLPVPPPLTQPAPEMHGPGTFQQFMERQPQAKQPEAVKNGQTVKLKTPSEQTPQSHPSKPAKHKKRHLTVKVDPGDTVSSPGIIPKTPTIEAPTEQLPETPTIDIPTEQLPKPPELINLHPESLTVPAEVSQMMAQNTVYLQNNGCSGWLIRNQANEPIGVSTAQHCRMLPKDGLWGTDADGTPTLNFPAPVFATTGDVITQMMTVGPVSEFALNPAQDNTKDIAIGALEGHTAEEAFDGYMQNKMSPEEVESLKTGDIIYNSGWPVDQKNADGTPFKRQEFAMAVLGTVNWQVSNGEQLNLLLAAVPANENGTECSWGDSGSLGFQLENGVRRDIGEASAFNDFGLLYSKDPEKAKAEREYIENLFGVSMEGFVGVCGFSYETTPKDSLVHAKVKTPSPEQQEHLDIVRDIELAKQHLRETDPEFTKHIGQGLVPVYYGKGSEKPDALLKDPYIDAENPDGVVITLSSAPGGGEPIANVFINPWDLKLYSTSEDGSLPIHESKGPILVNEDGTFADQEGFVFGETLDPAEWPLKPGKAYTLSIDKGGNYITIPVEDTPGPKG